MLAQKHRCYLCNFYLGLFAIKCKCTRIYCSKHLQPDSHGCNFDFKEDGRKRLEKQLVKIEAEKVIKI
jgi:hypothetical protein